ncbi:MAG: serine/threonine protein kinase, partial [Gammaproteobacteria bacterium]
MSPRSEYRQPPEDDGENSLLVTQLFGEWLSRREGPGEEQDVKSFLERAGNRSGELDQRIRLYLAMESFGGGVPESDEGSARIGRFQVLRTLGEGGLSSVYLALDPELKHEVALKVLRSNSGQGQGWILNEARSLARVQHPGVVRVFEVQRAGTSHVVVMEHLSGHSLDEIIDELCALKSELVRTSAADRKEKESKKSRKRQDAEALEPLSHRIRILLYLADALAHCHDRGILHRDIKPANIVFGGDGQPRLIDFGLAHLGENKDKETSLDITQNLVASPAYMAPEQVESEKT